MFNNIIESYGEDIMYENELEITICKSDFTQFLGVEIGVQIKHIPTGNIVRSTTLSSQYLNKIQALKLLTDKLQIEKENNVL